MLRVVVYDDKADFAKQTEQMLLKLFHREISVFICESSFALEHYVVDVMEGNVDIIFASLPFKAREVIEEVARIQADYPNVQVTFIAKAQNQAADIFYANPAYFMVRPVSERRLQEAMNRMLVRLRRVHKQIMVVEFPRGVLIIPQDEILYIESNRREITFVLTRGRRESGSGRLDELTERLGKGFIRCHQSYIVNSDKVRCILTKEVVLYNGQSIPVSRARYRQMKEEILEYLYKQI